MWSSLPLSLLGEEDQDWMVHAQNLLQLLPVPTLQPVDGVQDSNQSSIKGDEQAAGTEVNDPVEGLY